MKKYFRRCVQAVGLALALISVEVLAEPNAVRAIESGQSRSEEGVTQVTEAGAMLQRITGAVEAIRDWLEGRTPTPLAG